MVGDRRPLMFFVEKAGLNQPISVAGDGLEVAIQVGGNLIKPQTLVSGNENKDFNAALVGHAFEMPF